MLDNLDEMVCRSKLAPALLAAAISACATETILLNSERIEERFGSYGIDVLASEAGLRRSSLYSLENGERVCRTYAVVRFTDEPDISYTQEHARVLAGNSLGEVFKSNGWKLHKQSLHIGHLSIDGTENGVAKLMRLQGEQHLALHIYQLLLVRGESIHEYATIMETHHPEYLTEQNLLDIYSYDESESLKQDALDALQRLILDARH